MTPALNVFYPVHPQNAIKKIAHGPRIYCRSGLFLVFFTVLAWVLSGCSALPDKPVRPTLYDFGPGSVTLEPAAQQAPLPALALDDITTSGGALDNTALLYRLAYTEVQALRPYANARWSTPPAQLVRQRLREQLSLRRPVFNARDGVAINRSGVRCCRCVCGWSSKSSVSCSRHQTPASA